MSKKELDSQMLVHLEWMFENQPELVRRLHQSRKLLEHLENKNQQTLQYAQSLNQKGRTMEEALEVANQVIAAPSDGPAMSETPPDPVPWKEKETIQDALEKQLSGSL